MSASGSAKSRMERIMRLHDQIDEIKADIREVYAEEKGDGGDKTAMGAAISYLRKRAKDETAFDDREAFTASYLNAFNAPSHTHAREAAQSYTEANGIDTRISAEANAAIHTVRAPVDPSIVVGRELTDTQEQPETPAKQFQAKASEDNGATGTANVEVPSDSMAGEVSRLASGRTDAGEAASTDLPTISPSPVTPPAQAIVDDVPPHAQDASSAPISNPQAVATDQHADANIADRAGAESSPASAVNFDNPRCQTPDGCTFAHSRISCWECTMAWAKRPKDEQVRLWQEAMEAAETEAV